MNSAEVVVVVRDCGYPVVDAEEWYRKFVGHRHNAQQRGIATMLTFRQYLGLAMQAALLKPGFIGRERGCYHLSRYGDVGDYVLGNCRFLPAEENIREASKNGRLEESSALLRGQTKETSDRIRRMAETVTGRTKENHPGRAIQADKLAKEFLIRSPEGVIHRGKNVFEFCQQHGLDCSLMYKVFAGRNKHHKGWTGHYVSGDSA